jgi:integrase
MEYPQMKLSNRKCQATKYNPEGKGNKLFDGGGLYLQISETGKYWRLKYRFCNKEKVISFGPYPLITLLEAREKRDEAKKLLLKNLDPAEVRKLEKLEIQTKYENNFEKLVREWHSQRLHTWKPKHAESIIRRFEANIFPVIGNRPVRSLTPPEILQAVRRVEKRGNLDLAHRMLQMCSQVFRYAVATGRADRDICGDLRGALMPVRSKSYAHLKEEEMPAFLCKLERYETDYRGSLLTKLAFKLLVLTFVRSSEIRGAKWEEFDFEKQQWKIPAERMKMKTPHIVPLARQSIELLMQIQQLTGDNNWGLVFPGMIRPNRIMSDNTFLKVLAVLGYKNIATAHGFRSTASTVLNENGFKSDVIERQLAHCERNQVRAAYNYAEYLSERREMMQWWTDHIDKLRAKA